MHSLLTFPGVWFKDMFRLMLRTVRDKLVDVSPSRFEHRELVHASALTCDCTMCRVEADALSARWQKKRLLRRTCMGEVIIHTSTCSPHCHGNKHLLAEAKFFSLFFFRFLFFFFFFPQRPLGFGSERCQKRNFILKWEIQKQSLLLSPHDS